VNTIYFRSLVNILTLLQKPQSLIHTVKANIYSVVR